MSFEEVRFKGEEEKRKRDDGLVPVYETFTPPMVKMITMGAKKPPLLPSDDEALGKLQCYEVDGMHFFAFLRLLDADEQWDVQTPLAMCHYVKPEGDMLFSMQACEDATTENARRSVHNKFVVDVFRRFMPVYDCGSSANLMTMPQPPDSYTYLRQEKIKELKKDKLEYTHKAIEYLAQKAAKYCGLDYKWEEAWAKADEACFENTICDRQEKGKVRVRIEGRRPCWWDGKSKRDESGFKVKWARGESHTFLTPDLRVVADTTEDEVMLVDDSARQIVLSDGTTAAAPGSNPFETLFTTAAHEMSTRGPRIEVDEEPRDPPSTPDLERRVTIEDDVMQWTQSSVKPSKIEELDD
jgi:hypothetical protein